jgi:hypothetical protein
MHRSATVFALYLSFAIAVGAACGQPAGPETPDEDSFNASGGTGNTGSTGGSAGKGGSVTGGTGGSVTGGTGGSVTGGGAGVGMVVGGAGGVMGGAGRANTGGAGGSVSGSAGTGGAVSAGGAGGAGGSSGGMGGSVSGSAGTGALGVTCDTAFAVGMDGFVRVPAKDGSCWHGYAYGTGNGCTASGCTADTTISYCGDATATNFTKCMGMLSISGTLEAAVDPDYAGYVLIGFSLNEAVGGGTKGTVTPKGASLVVTGAAAGGRVQLQAGSNYWCAPFTSGTPIPYATFNTKCWDNSGTAYSTATPIDTIALQIPGGMANAAYTITLTSVAEM